MLLDDFVCGISKHGDTTIQLFLVSSFLPFDSYSTCAKEVAKRSHIFGKGNISEPIPTLFLQMIGTVGVAVVHAQVQLSHIFWMEGL